MALVSPGVDVSITDESQYAPNSVSTVPLVIVASAENKITPQGTVASGTLAENAGDLYVLTSQRDVVNFFGTPTFYTDTNGTPIHGYELNEYGLQTAYSLLGTTSRAYVLRADVNLGELVGTGTRPTAEPLDMTYWLEPATTRFGIFSWNNTTQTFDIVTPIVITNTNELIGGVPLASIGTVGSYAVVGTSSRNPVYYKNTSNDWVLVGSTDWMNSIPSVTSGATNPAVTPSESIEINGTIVTLSGSTVTTTASDINNASITGITASVAAGKLQIFIDDTAASDGSTTDGAMVITNDTGTPLADLEITAGTYYRPAVQQSSHTSVPQWKTADSQSRPTRSIWVKTSAVNNGASFSVKRYNALIGSWELISAPLYENDQSANVVFDPVRGGSSIPVGSLYVQYDVSEDDTLTYRVLERLTTGATIVTGTEVNPTLELGESFSISYSTENSSTMSTPTTITLTGTTVASMAQDILAAGLPNVSASVLATGEISISHSAGGVLELAEVSGTPLADAGITASDSVYARSKPDSTIIISNWGTADVEVSETAPGIDPATEQKWYWSEVGEADIMIHDGTTWKGYKNVTSDARGYNLSNTDPKGPIFSATKPTQQSDQSALAYGDIWIDTSDLENYPKLYRYELVSNSDEWVEIDTGDQTSEDGILFADARFMGDGTTDVNSGEITRIDELLTNDYLDLDAPNPALYPRGMILFNTRRSSFNVKEYRSDYFNNSDFAGEVLPTEKNTWVSVSGSRENGHAFFGRKSQRNVIVAAMKAAIDGNSAIREEQRQFNLISAPGYPELITNMVQLNNDRKQTAFIVGDSPMRVASEGTELSNWLTNSDLNGVDGENSLVTTDPYVGIWYPSVLGSDLGGNNVAMPSSYAVMRMMIRSDQISYPWFAPAGTRRGTIDNATRLGYLNNGGEFVSIGVREGVRDTLYENRVNPLIQTPQTGIVAFGQKTRASGPSSLDRVNVARLVAYLRGQLDLIVRPFLFEPNDKITRDEVKGVIDSFLNDLVAKRALYDYLSVCDDSNNTPARIDRNELYVDVAIEPVKAVEFIYIPVRIQNTGSIGS
jgi:hypothetical protein